MAAREASEAELDDLERQFAELKQLSGLGSDYWRAFLKREIEFHFAVASLSHNRVSLAVLNSLATWIQSFSPYVPELAREPMLADWEAVLQALRERDGERAQALIGAHIRAFNQQAAE